MKYKIIVEIETGKTSMVDPSFKAEIAKTLVNTFLSRVETLANVKVLDVLLEKSE